MSSLAEMRSGHMLEEGDWTKVWHTIEQLAMDDYKAKRARQSELPISCSPSFQTSHKSGKHTGLAEVHCDFLLFVVLILIDDRNGSDGKIDMASGKSSNDDVHIFDVPKWVRSDAGQPFLKCFSSKLLRRDLSLSINTALQSVNVPTPTAAKAKHINSHFISSRWDNALVKGPPHKPKFTVYWQYLKLGFNCESCAILLNPYNITFGWHKYLHMSFAHGLPLLRVRFWAWVGKKCVGAFDVFACVTEASPQLI
ncbi:hypothetical protein EDD18DRAFT_1108845 [Armillaria luteobubalina]|uniref:Uncharacterized protein n=1 Tax=Armillaria luteobubalina TaxID=153913 RepID=A0AA39PZ85_9AGAR|nr:hypothetical protein EDD18DRAFT_1108845 [Armillaria luteobubalina]